MCSVPTDGRKLFTPKIIFVLLELGLVVFFTGQSDHTTLKNFSIPLQNAANRFLKPGNSTAASTKQSKTEVVLKQDELAILPNKTASAVSGQPKQTISKNAFALFLVPPHGAGKESDDMNDDDYFVATRMLVYQLLYDPSTRTHTEWSY